METHLRALALIRAVQTHDADTVNAILAEGAGPELARALASFVVAVSEEVLGSEQSLKNIDYLLGVASDLS